MMTRLLPSLALAVVLGLPTSPAAAQASKAQRYAQCLAETQPKLVHDLFAGDAGAVEQAYRRLAHNERCFSRAFGDKDFRPDEAALKLDLLRGRLAERALSSRAADAAALQPLALKQQRYLRPWFATSGRNAAVDEMAACMADTNPNAIVGLLQTEPDSTFEASALGAMSQSLTQCLAASTRLDANRSALRAALADALYQRLSNPQLSLIPNASGESPK